MQKAGIEPLPFEQDNMCPMIAAYVLNRKKGYGIPMPQPNCMMAMFYGHIHGALGHFGLHMQLYEDEKLVTGKMKLVRKQNDGLLLLRSKSNPNIFHFIAFIVQGSELTFYDPEGGNLNLYRLKDHATAMDFDNDFRQFFPNEEIVQVSLFEPNGGGMRLGAIKKAALQNLKDHGITGIMLETAFHQLKVRAGVKVVSKMFGFKSWGYLRSDHVLEIKNKDGIMFRYKIARGKKHPVIMAKIPGSSYEEIMTVHVPDYDSRGDWTEAKHQARHVTRKLKLKPRYRKTRKN